MIRRQSTRLALARKRKERKLYARFPFIIRHVNWITTHDVERLRAGNGIIVRDVK